MRILVDDPDDAGEVQLPFDVLAHLVGCGDQGSGGDAERPERVAGQTIDRRQDLRPSVVPERLAAVEGVLDEAGGRLTAFDGTEIIYNRPSTRHHTTVGAGAALHQALVDLAHEDTTAAMYG